MSFIILVRMNNDDLWTIEDSDKEGNLFRVTEFPTLEEAETWLDGSMLKSQGWEIVEVDI